MQWVKRPNLDFRGFSGQIASGVVKPGDEIRVLPSGKTSSIKSIVTMNGDLEQATAGASVTLTFNDEIDCSRGDVICAASDPAEAADSFESTLVWMDEHEMLPGRSYVMKIGTQTVNATVQHPKYRVDVNSIEQLAAKTLQLNDIGVCSLTTDKRVVLEAYDDIERGGHELGGFILIDKMTNATVAAGMLNFALRRSENVHANIISSAYGFIVSV